MSLVEQVHQTPDYLDCIAVGARDDLQLIASVLRIESRRLRQSGITGCPRALGNVSLRLDVLSMVANRQFGIGNLPVNDDQLFTALFEMLMRHHGISSFSSQVDLDTLTSSNLRRGLALILNEILIFCADEEDHETQDAQLDIMSTADGVDMEMVFTPGTQTTKPLKASVLEAFVKQHNCDLQRDNQRFAERWTLSIPSEESLASGASAISQ